MTLARLELHGSGAPTVVPLRPGRTTIGKRSAIVAIDDRTVSRLHAVIESIAGGWIVHDLGSRNGTFVNGTRVTGQRALRDGDEIRFGTTTARFLARRVADPGRDSMTSPLAPPPQLSRRERDLVVALCRPLLEASMLTEPASVRTLAEELHVSESAVKKLLARTYDRFALHDDERRRGRLAREALQRGVVGLGDAESAP